MSVSPPMISRSEGGQAGHITAASSAARAPYGHSQRASRAVGPVSARSAELPASSTSSPPSRSPAIVANIAPDRPDSQAAPRFEVYRLLRAMYILLVEDDPRV